MPISQWSPQQLQQNLLDNKHLLLLDVREGNEFAYARIEGSLNIPLGQIPGRVDELDTERDIAVICHHGIRSQQACQYLQQVGFVRLYNLKGGIDAWSVVCDPAVPRY
ncbi:MAG: rhodanese-like domain-containing protein [Methylococcales bacterium]|nr:rhodanese-like domain-containing protein [Methylococcales bacterium]